MNKDLKARSKATGIIGLLVVAFEIPPAEARDTLLFLCIFEQRGLGTLEDEELLKQEGCGR